MFMGKTMDWQKISCLLMAWLIVSMGISPAFAAEADASPDGLPINPDDISEEPDITRTGFSCHSPSTHPDKKVLDPNEVAALKEKLQVDGNGFQGDKISSGAPANQNRDSLGNPQSAVVIPTGKDGEATLKSIPTKKFLPKEMQHWLNKDIKGPFAFGISLDDTLRVGVCRDIPGLKEEGQLCWVEGKGAEYRNSATGIKGDFKLVGTEFKDMFGDAMESITGEKTIPELSKEDEDRLRENMALETDAEGLKAQVFTRPASERIPNTIHTEKFSTTMGSTCNTADCLISSYSMFDKYFNTWFSTELVVSNFGPTLFGQTKRLIGYPGRFGWPWKLEDKAFFQWFRRTFAAPDSMYGKVLANRINTRARKYGFGEFLTKMMENNDWDSGYTAIKGGSYRKWMNEALKPGGYIDEIKDPIRRGEFYKIVKDLRNYSRAQRDVLKSADDIYKTTLSRFGESSFEARNALMAYGKINAKTMLEMDQILKLDGLEWWVRDAYSNMYPLAVKHGQSGSIVTLVGDSQHISNIATKFVDDGDWASWAGNRAYEATSDGFLQVYKVDPAGEFIDSVPVEDLKKHFSRFRDKMVKTEKGEVLKLTETNLDYIVNGVPGTGKVPIYDLKWAKADPITPEQFAAKLTHSRVASRFGGSFSKNMDFLHKQVVEKNFAGANRRYFSVLDRAMAREEEILKSYFSLRGGAKWTVLPYAYWGARRGFGVSDLSAYMLPDSWREMEFYLGSAPIYNDAFVDFFAGHGSDEGDMFKRILNILPWKMILNEVSNKFNPMKETYDRATGVGWRSKVENVAYFTSTGNECAGCTMVLKMRSPESALVGEGNFGVRGDMCLDFAVRREMESYLLEDAISDDAKEEGSTLISYGHHTNLRGRATDTEQKGEIDLVRDKSDGDTCKQKVESLGYGIGAASGILGDDPSRIGLFLAAGESLGYATFLWSGIIGSVAMQTLITPELQDCTDDKEGYFVHMFAPSDKEQENQKTGSEAASEKSTDIIKNIFDTLLGPGNEEESKQAQSTIEQFKNKIREQVDVLEQKARSNTILQASLETFGTTDAELFSKELFFFWFRGETSVSKYDETTKTKIEDKENDINVTIDNKTGQILINGKPVITSADHIRLSSANGNIPAFEVPQRIGEIELPTDPELLLFEWKQNGQFTVSSAELLDCIRHNIEEQTGVGIATGNISDAFGPVESIVTDSHTITADSKTGAMVATGAPRRIVVGGNARAEVYADMGSFLKNGEEANVGKMQSIQFKHGVIIYKPENHELVIWLKRNASAIAKKSDISGVKATPENVINPLTECPEPAINLEALPVPGSDAIAERVSNLNKSLQKVGPFQIFDTEKHRFIFYSQLLPDGTCEDRVKILDKETGEVYDQAIVGGIENTPTGIKFNTDDGQEHTFDFTADNGVPRISHNGNTPETLTTAQGPNGSFWYDPNTGFWNAENAQLLPLIEAFKQRGFNTSVGPDGKVSSVASGNNLNVQIGGGSDTPFFNLPSLPQNPFMFLFVISLLLAAMVLARLKIEGG